MKPPRILYGGLFHETHTLLPEPTGWADFAITRDAAILGKAGDESPTAGFLEEAARFGWEVVPTIDARALPSGPVEDAMFERYWKEFEQRARPALAAGVDGIFLVLHGAMDPWVTGALPGLTKPAAAALVDAAGGQVRAKYGWTDVARFAALGVPAVNFGPGDPNFAHRVDERVEVEQITAATDMLRRYLSA